MNHQDILTLQSLRGVLTPLERDLLRGRLSFECGRLFHEIFDLPDDEATRQRLDRLMAALTGGAQLPDYGLVYRGRPPWMSDELLDALCTESDDYASEAYMNAYQQIARVDSERGDTVSERLARSAPLLDLVHQHAGACQPLHITSYLHYTSPTQFCEPHTDTQRIPISALVELRHEWTTPPHSRTVNYWPGRPRLDHLGEPGEISIFFGCHALHGRTAPGPGERVSALLMSFRPLLGNRLARQDQESDAES